MASKELTDKQKRFLDVLFDEEVAGDIRMAMNIAGYSPTASISNMIESIAEEIHARTQQYLAANAPKAALSMTGVLKAPHIPGIQNTLRAAEQILDRTGHVKTEKLAVSVNGTGLFIIPPKDSNG